MPDHTRLLPVSLHVAEHQHNYHMPVLLHLLGHFRRAGDPRAVLGKADNEPWPAHTSECESTHPGIRETHRAVVHHFFRGVFGTGTESTGVHEGSWQGSDAFGT